MKMLAILLCSLMASLVAAQEKLSLVYDAGKTHAAPSVLDIGRAFKAVPNAERLVIVSGSFVRSLSSVHSPFYATADGPVPCGGWLGCEAWAPSMTPLLPLKCVMGEHAQSGIAGDSAGIFAQWQWCWSGCIDGACALNTTYREKNNYFKQKIEAGPGKAYLIDFRTALKNYYQHVAAGGAPTTTGPQFGYAELAIGRYLKDFSVPNASPKWQHHHGVAAHGAPTWVRGIYHKADAGWDKTHALVQTVRERLDPSAWLVDLDGTSAIPATQALVGWDKVYPVVPVTLDGTLEQPDGTVIPSMNPVQFVSWLNAVDYPHVVISAQADSIAVSNALAGLLSGQ